MRYVCSLFLTVVFFSSCGQNKPDASKDNIRPETKSVLPSGGPKQIVRNVIQDRKGNIWIAAFDGIFRYDARLTDGQGKSFTNITSKVSSARFFSVLEDSKGNFWFGSIGSGVFLYDGRSFRNFTTKDGLINNDVTCIYEDKAGNIWFGTGGGASCYDGKSFRNYMMNGGVNSIIEDKTGKFWFATPGNTFVYDGKKFTVFTHGGKPFENVRSMIEDKKGNIWLGGSDGLWRYYGSTFTNFTQKFVGSIYEDKKGNIWTSSERDNSQPWASSERGNSQAWTSSQSAYGQGWVLSRYDEQSSFKKKTTVTETNMASKMIFGIFEANDGNIWFGTGDGVYRYNGSTITDFKGK